jgi:glycyl-tRNA synthetase beta chain
METHQKCFGVEGHDGELLPFFITVLNITPPSLKSVQIGWERVLTARLEDADFFWKADLNSGLNAWAERLDNIIFLAPLGSMGDKCRRLEKLCTWLAKKVQHPHPAEMARSGRIAKADLCSGMVGEFGSLQGIMGSIYARHNGEHQAIAQALREQYFPAGPDTPVPESLSGAILSMADKADTMMGCFGLNMIPTGAADPYALRRCALGILRIALKYEMRFDLTELFAEAQDLYTNINWKLPPDDALAKVMEFTILRVKSYFTVNKDYDVLIVEAALGTGLEDICSTIIRIEALSAFSRKSHYEQAVHTFKRLANIIAKVEGADLEYLSGNYASNLLKEDAEKKLVAKLEEIAPRFDALWQKNSFAELFELLEEVRPTVDAFFDQVMVMDKDDAVRRNRLNILQALAGRLGMLADFKALQM